VLNFVVAFIRQYVFVSPSNDESHKRVSFSPGFLGCAQLVVETALVDDASEEQGTRWPFEGCASSSLWKSSAQVRRASKGAQWGGTLGGTLSVAQ